MVSQLRSRFVLALALVCAWLWACGGAPTPKADAPLVVGAGNSAREGAAKTAPSEEGLVVPILANDAVRGPRDALVTLVVFSDFQCPFCARFAPTLDEARQAYGNDVRIVFKHEPLPFHEHAYRAAEIGVAVRELAGNDAFWRFHDRVFREQRRLGEEGALRGWAIEEGIDAKTLDAGLTDKRWAKKVDADLALAKKLDINGTPTMLVNGALMSGAQPLLVVRQNIDRELEKAKALVAKGVAREAVFAEVVAANVEARPKDDGDDDDDDKPDVSVWKVPVGSSPVRGPNTALVTLVLFSDFQCPYCKKVEPTLARVRTEYGDRLRIVWKDQPLPFHPRALPAAKLARSARAQKGDAAFWDVHDKLFDSAPALEDADLEKIAKAAGLDVKKAMADVRAAATPKAMYDDEDLADAVKAAGTPHMFINGRRLVGAQPFEKIKSFIDEELAKADALVRSGTAKTAVYETTIKAGLSNPAETKQVTAPSPLAPFRGPINGKLVIQQFSDFQCPFCKRVEPTLDDLMLAFPGKIKIVWRHLPLSFHADAELAAEAAEEGYAQRGNVGFWKMHELIFAHQSDPDGLKRPALEGYARQAQLDLTKFGQALDSHTHKARIDADKKAADDAKISGTPAFMVGPYYVSGAQAFSKFKKLAERVLGETAKPLPPKPAPAPAPAAAAVAPSAPPSPAAPGLVIKDSRTGSGREAKSGDRVKVHYVGKLTDGTEFDSSKKHGQPFTFELGRGRVIKGWDQGVVGMKVGGTRTLTIPPDLAYGARGAGGVVPPNATLVFDIELLSIETPASP